MLFSMGNPGFPLDSVQKMAIDSDLALMLERVADGRHDTAAAVMTLRLPCLA